jgi:hypothetical protein
MTRRPVVLPEAEEDIREATAPSRKRAACPSCAGTSAGGAVLARSSRLHRRRLTRAAEAPQACAAWPDDPRYRRVVVSRFPYVRVVVSRFPYVVFIEVLPDSVEFVAVAHASREPGFWLARR